MSSCDAILLWLTDQQKNGVFNMVTVLHSQHNLTINYRDTPLVILFDNICTVACATGEQYTKDLRLIDPKFFDELGAAMAASIDLIDRFWTRVTDSGLKGR